MTAQSGRGQGDEPLYEGVVLPANGDPWTPEQQRQVAQPHAQPPAGQPWGQPWGPESQQAVPQQQAEYGAPGAYPSPYSSPDAYGSAGAYGHGGAPSYGDASYGAFGGQDPYGSLGGSGAEVPPPPPQMPPPPAQVSAPLPASAPPPPAGPPPQAPPTPPPAFPALPEPGAGAGYDAYAGQPPQQPPYQPPTGPPNEQGALPDGRLPSSQAPGALPPAAPEAGRGPRHGRPPQPQPSDAFGAGAPIPPYAAEQAAQGGHGADAEATQYLPPMPGAGPYAAPQPQPQPDGDAEATQMLPPMAGGPSGQAGEGGDAAGLRSPLPPESGGSLGGAGYGETSQAHAADPATQAGPPPRSAPYGIRPGAPEEGQRRQPPAGFESLFRTEEAPPGTPGPGASGPVGADEPGSTQHLPVFDEAAPPPRGAPHSGRGRGGYGYPGPSVTGIGAESGPGAGPASAPPPGPGDHGGRRAAGRGGPRLSPVVLVAIGVVVVAGIGVAAGLGLSGGGGDDAKPVAQGGGKSPAGDAVKGQAQQLDALLDDSNNSRSAVVGSVENIKSCKRLVKADKDLHAAARQRNGLATRLDKLETDKLPNHDRLTSALTRAWKSSAAADLHYATWAKQVGGKKGCHKGKARLTAQTGAGTRSSGQATTAKKEAARLWKPIATKYGLKQRQFSQL